MKNKVIATRVSFVLTIVFVVLAIAMSFFNFQYHEIVANIGYAVFGSSLVTFAISLIDYLSAKKNSYENFYLEYVEYINTFGKIPYLDIGEEEIVFSKYLSNKKMFWKIDSTSKNNFIDSVRNEFSKNDPRFSNLSNDELEKYLDYNSDVFEEKLKPVLALYIEFAKYPLMNLGRLYSDFYFLLKNKKMKTNIYDALYKPAVELSRLIQIEASHFTHYIDGCGQNVFVMVCKLNELTEKLFKKKIEGNSIKVYAEKYDCMSDNLENFRCKMYGIVTKKQDHEPIYASFKNVDVRFDLDKK